MNARFKVTMAIAGAAAAVLAGAVAGCGGDDGSASNGSSLSKEEFVKQANAACTEEREERALGRVIAYRKRHGSEGLSEEELNRRAYRAAVLGTSEAEIAAIRALGAPEGEEEEVEAILTGLEAAVEEARNQAKTSLTAEEYFTNADKKLRRYGLNRCTKTS